jgi:hypothetical protein
MPKKLAVVGLAMLGLLATQTSRALPFGGFDARSVAMGGVGVATGYRYASFNNPALLTTADEIHEWFLLFPTAGYQLGDPDKLDNGLSDFQQAADQLDADPTAANRDQVLSRLNALDNHTYREFGNAAFMLAVPSRILSGAAFMNVYKGFTARPRLGGDNLSDPANPSYGSAMEYRGLWVLENGVSAAKLLDGGKQWWNNLALGFNAKFLLTESYGYSAPIRDAELKLDEQYRSSGSAFQLDVGVLREFGVFKVALVGKNLLATEFDYGATGDKFKLGPQLRLGLAYQSRSMVLELDADLLENDPLGFDSHSQELALGWEYALARWFTLRAGYRQNLVGTKSGSASLGLGLLMGAFYIDVAAARSTELDGVAAQFGFQF